MGVNEGDADVYCTPISPFTSSTCNDTRGGRQRWLIIAATSQYELEPAVNCPDSIKSGRWGLHSSFSSQYQGHSRHEWKKNVILTRNLK